MPDKKPDKKPDKNTNKKSKIDKNLYISVLLTIVIVFTGMYLLITAPQFSSPSPNLAKTLTKTTTIVQPNNTIIRQSGQEGYLYNLISKNGNSTLQNFIFNVYNTTNTTNNVKYNNSANATYSGYLRERYGNVNITEPFKLTFERYIKNWKISIIVNPNSNMGNYTQYIIKNNNTEYSCLTEVNYQTYSNSSSTSNCQKSTMHNILNHYLNFSSLNVNLSNYSQKTYYGIPCLFIKGTVSNSSNANINYIGNFSVCTSNTYFIPMNISFNLKVINKINGSTVLFTTVLSNTNINNNTSIKYIDTIPENIITHSLTNQTLKNITQINNSSAPAKKLQLCYVQSFFSSYKNISCNSAKLYSNGYLLLNLSIINPKQIYVSNIECESPNPPSQGSQSYYYYNGSINEENLHYSNTKYNNVPYIQVASPFNVLIRCYNSQGEFYFNSNQTLSGDVFLSYYGKLSQLGNYTSQQTAQVVFNANAIVSAYNNKSSNSTNKITNIPNNTQRYGVNNYYTFSQNQMQNIFGMQNFTLYKANQYLDIGGINYAYIIGNDGFNYQNGASMETQNTIQNTYGSPQSMNIDTAEFMVNSNQSDQIYAYYDNYLNSLHGYETNGVVNGSIYTYLISQQNNQNDYILIALKNTTFVYMTDSGSAQPNTNLLIKYLGEDLS